MSRIGKLPITIPAGVELSQTSGMITAKGPKGELSVRLLPGFDMQIADNQAEVVKKADTRVAQQQFGLMRTLVFNLVQGVSEGFSKQLELQGVGYRVALKGKALELSLGYSHPINFTPPEGIELKVEQNIITVTGADKQLVGEAAANIREFRKPEPYKGKGIRYIDEYVRRKAGKTAAKAAE
jgi:large subunit ribosomal protein L6